MKKKPSKSSVSVSYEPTTRSMTGDEAVIEFGEALANLLVGVNPYMDISTVHIMVMDLLAEGVEVETAYKKGQEIAKRARISITNDTPGGLQ